ncbi:12972_t:CDS:2, partial [Entrophospora sp. SA101]
VQELKSQVSDLQKRLRSALKDVDKTESYILVREQQLAILEEEVIKLKNRIRKITSRKYNKPVIAQTIQVPGPNEYQTTAESVRNAFRNIDVYYQQIGNLTNQLTKLQGQLTNTNNNFDLINQAYNFQTGQLQTCQTDLQNWHRKHAKRKGKHVKQKAKHKKWENKEKDSWLRIINLNQQILTLQNNLQNMTAIGDLTGITPLLANVEFYDGHVQPDEWYNKIPTILAIPAITNLNDANKQEEERKINPI